VSAIAAGEVIERPASIVKELLENSLDAGASTIRVEIEHGGQRLIRVRDDGHGIPADQVELAFARHATSKIRAASDLRSISTLGFRGEALPSIAAVCNVTLVTRTAEENQATQVSLSNGTLQTRRSVGAPQGTIFTARDLFHSMPARLKFLRTPSTEAGHVYELVTRYALAYPHCHFTLLVDGKPSFQSPGTGELRDVLIALYGLDVARALLPVEAVQSGVSSDTSVQGYVSPPSEHRATRRYISFVVNGRWVQDRSLSYAVTEAYHTFLPTGRYPIATLSIGVDPEAVDVNVHPAKAEVRFADARSVFATVQRAVRQVLLQQAPVAHVGATSMQAVHAALPEPQPWPDKAGQRYAMPREPAPASDTPVIPSLPMLRVLGQLGQTYVVAEGPQGMFLIDQHAAHERVLYERLLSDRQTLPAQALLDPVVVAVSPAQVSAAERHADVLARFGIQVEPFGRDSVVVRAVPTDIRPGDVAAAVGSALEAVAVGEVPLRADLEQRVASAVCKQASVKAGQTLSLEEMRSLLRDLERTANPRTCPHGRPTMILMTSERLQKEFGRT
jgi:DNA mismatch repair protein MutL